MIFNRSLEDSIKRKLVWKKNKLYKTLSILIYLIGIMVALVMFKIILVSKEFLIVLVIIYLCFYFFLEKIYQLEVTKLSQPEVKQQSENINDRGISQIINKKSNIFKIIVFSFIGFFVLIILFITIGTLLS